jgi:hypothetical protein
MDKVQKYASTNANTSSSETYRSELTAINFSMEKGMLITN